MKLTLTIKDVHITNYGELNGLYRNQRVGYNPSLRKWYVIKTGKWINAFDYNLIKRMN